MDDLKQKTQQYLDESGPFAELIPKYKTRDGQQQLSQQVAEALSMKTTLVAEAGTGIGKTFAYLVPCVASEKKTLISTGTKTLQDQIFNKDLPTVLKALKSRCKPALLKGRANYLCLYRMEQARTEGRFPKREMFAQLESLKKWSEKTRDGDLSRFSGIQDDDPLRPWVSSSRENCIGTDCPDFDHCFVFKARRKALEADIIVVNHHLLFADLAIRQTGFAEILPECRNIIIDEAHQVPETATTFFSDSLSARQLRDLAADTRLAAAEISGALPTINSACNELEDRVKRFHLALPETQDKAPWQAIAQKHDVQDNLNGLKGSLKQLKTGIQNLKAGHTGLDHCIDRANDHLNKLAALEKSESNDLIIWYERGNRHFNLNITPLDISEPFQAFCSELESTWVYTSATLSVKGNFDHFNHQLGLKDPITLSLNSPFDYWHNALLYHPPGLPEPRDRSYVEQLMEACEPVLTASDGRAFLLFTSHRALKLAADWLRTHSDYSLFVQGEASRPELLQGFQSQSRALLLGAASFWEGVDVPGQALSCVIIDKLPFQPPDDPVLNARMEKLRSEGGNPFFDFQLPQAIITLKQGVGRLIRTESDFGIIVLADPRLRSKAYGKAFIESLPKIPKTTEVQNIQRFFDHKTSTDQEPKQP